MWSALVIPLRIILDTSLEKGIFPDKRKLANVPFFKNGKKIGMIIGLYKYCQFLMKFMDL